MTFHPVNFRFGGGTHGPVRPVFVRTRSTLWRCGGTSLAAETQHEIGANPLNHYALVVGLGGGSRQAERVQIFVGASPGNELLVSPTIGALRDGVAVGARVHLDVR